MSSLVWLFKAHRDQYRQLMDLQRENDQLRVVVAQLEAQLQAPRDPKQLLEAFRDEVLVDQPFPEGKIPDDFWLTPGRGDR